MTDIFFSYASGERDRIRPIHDALKDQGFEIFWDQDVPAGFDWDTWIRLRLKESKCVIVFWSAASARSVNVRHEAKMADDMHKLVTVLLEPLRSDQFPMGLYFQQAISLVDWKPNSDHAGWQNLNRVVEEKLTPRWMQRKMDGLAEKLRLALTRSEAAEKRNGMLQAEISLEVQKKDELSEKAAGEAIRLNSAIADLTRARDKLGVRVQQLSSQLSLLEQEKRRTSERADLPWWHIDARRIRAIANDMPVLAIWLFASLCFIGSSIGIFAAGGLNKFVAVVFAVLSLTVVIACYRSARP